MDLSIFALNGKVAVVTGGNSGIGRGIAEGLAEAGADIVIAARRFEQCREVCSEIEKKTGVRCLPMRCDVTKTDDANGLIESTVKEFGKVDILVNSAALDPKFDPEAVARGITPGKFEDYPLEQWNAALDVNLTGMFLVTQACVQPMLAQGKKGSIINICSTYGLKGPDQRIYRKAGRAQTFKPVYYTVTKAGVLGFTKYLAAYYMGTELRVNALSPGGCSTITMKLS